MIGTVEEATTVGASPEAIDAGVEGTTVIVEI